MLLNSNGNIDEIVDYDITGQVIDWDPYFYVSLGFMGSLNAEKGLWKLGSRYYDSGKGSFIQQDRYMGDPGDPLSLNRYVYCGLDPVNFVDPTGFCGLYLPAEKPIAQVLLEYGINWAQNKSYNTFASILQGIKGILYPTYSSDMRIGIVPFVPGNGLSGGLNFTKTTTLRMQTPGRYVPVEILKDAIESTIGVSDPQGTNALMHYTTINRNGQMYNLEVLFDHETNTVLHFEYTRDAIGGLPAIPKNK
jgi:RHS repeat-associated protein